MQRGSITKVSGGWKARYRLGGRSSSERSRTFTRKSDAQAWLTESLAKLNTGLVVDPNAGRVPFKDAAEAWTASRLHVRESTRLSDRLLLDRFLGDGLFYLLKRDCRHRYDSGNLRIDHRRHAAVQPRDEGVAWRPTGRM